MYSYWNLLPVSENVLSDVTRPPSSIRAEKKLLRLQRKQHRMSQPCFDSAEEGLPKSTNGLTHVKELTLKLRLNCGFVSTHLILQVAKSVLDHDFYNKRFIYHS